MTYQYEPKLALAHLTTIDPRLGFLIEAVGPYRLRNEATYSPFESLLRAIVYQHVSTRSAAAVYCRLRGMFGCGRIRPERLLGLQETALRSVGLSNAKVLAARDLATGVIAGTVPNRRRMVAMTDRQIITELVKVRGVGPWTAQMFLIFGLGRPDVLPAGDLGVRKGFALLHGLAELPAPKALLAHGEVWRPYRSAATWYLWRANDSVAWEESDPVAPT